MNNISVTVANNTIGFSKYNKGISAQNLNNTNIINTKNLKFTEEYIKENMELISTFFNLLILKFKVNKVIVKDLEIAETVVSLINTLNPIKYIVFSEDNSLSYTVASLLLQNKNLVKIECYNMPEMMFYRFNNDIIKTRGKLLSTSSFFKFNNINTYSDIYNKRTIVIPKLFDEKDIEDLKYFFETNKNLKKVEFKPYNRINLETILKILNKNHFRKVNIIIYEDELNTKDILSDISFFDKLNKRFNVDIRIKYSKKYKEKNKIKEFNLVFLRNILIASVIILLCFFWGFKSLENNDDENIKNSINKIEQALENAGEQSNSILTSYFADYSKVYEELLKINSDTVGWLKVNGTNINYPIVQSENNEYYLSKAYDKTNNTNGWLFVDYRNNMDDLDQNTIIYGHNSHNKELMFATLENVLNSQWYNNPENLIIDFSVKGIEYKWEVFSIYSIDDTSDYLLTEFKSEKSFLKFANKLKNRSIKNFNINLNSTDKILTLSTCYKDSKHRVVLHARLFNV